MALFLAFFLALGGSPQGNELNNLVDGVDKTFARMRDFSADFVQIFEDALNRKRQESGHLYLMKPRLMRWEYKNPEDKLFVSDGKTIYNYVPADRQVGKEPVSDAVDDRIPMMFLLGRSGLRNEFARFELLSDKPFLPGDKVLRMYPRRKTDFNEIVIEVDPVGYLIRRLVFTRVDGERSEFLFMNIVTNSGLKRSLFDFTPPAGVEVLSGIGK
jgi:outer membrane lipoprotein carrier protein